MCHGVAHLNASEFSHWLRVKPSSRTQRDDPPGGNLMSVKSITCNLSLGVAAGVLMIAATPVLALDNAGSLSGIVNGANGQPVAGAAVPLQNAGKRLHSSVVSQAGGRYTASDLPPGSYTVQGIGGTMQSAISAPVTVSANQTAQSNVALNANRGPLLAPSWPGRVPQAQLASIPTSASALPEGEGKAIVAEK